MKAKVYQIHKRNSYVFKDIQDKYAIDLNRKIFALSDGATQGYKSEIWAGKLTDSFKNNPTFEVPKLIALFKNTAEEFSTIDFGVNENVALRALESRKKELGSFATFLGVSIQDDLLHFISSGDVCAFIFNGNAVQSFPFKSVEELDKDKGFLGTAKILKNEIEESQFKTDQILLKNGDVLFLMTDALARLVLKDNQILFDLTSIKNFEEFKNYIVEKWDTKVLEEDDITAMLIYQDKKDDLTEFIPPDDFSFPKEEKPEYTKVAQPLLKTNELTDTEMKEIHEEFRKLNIKLQGLESQNSILKKDLNFFKLITLLTLGISLLAFSAGGYSLAKSFFSKKKFPTEKISAPTNVATSEENANPTTVDSQTKQDLTDGQNNSENKTQNRSSSKSSNSKLQETKNNDESVQNVKQANGIKTSSDNNTDKSAVNSTNQSHSPSGETDNKNGQ